LKFLEIGSPVAIGVACGDLIQIAEMSHLPRIAQAIGVAVDHQERWRAGHAAGGIGENDTILALVVAADVLQEQAVLSGSEDARAVEAPLVAEQSCVCRDDGERCRFVRADDPVLRLRKDLGRGGRRRRLHEEISVGVEKELGILSAGKSGEQENEGFSGSQHQSTLEAAPELRWSQARL
jgi:hypothetical protein